MILVEFAPNETNQDALLALRMLFQPWRWRKGKEITKLRQRLRKRFFSDRSDITFFLTGRNALYHYLKSLSLKEGNEVLVQAFTCEAVVLPILAQKLTPVYIDIRRDDLSMNLEDLKRKYTPKAKVLILQHSFGITPIERSKIIAFAKEKKLEVLEDLAHGFDTSLFNKKIQQSSLLLSFGRSKSLSGVFGGALVAKNKKISDYLSKIERKQPYPSTIFLTKMALYKPISVFITTCYQLYIGTPIHFIINHLGLLLPEISTKEKKGQYDNMYSKSFPNISAIFILQQINRFNDVNRKKVSTIKYFTDKLRQSKHYKNALLRYPYITKDREKLLKQAKKKGFSLGQWYKQVIAPATIDLKKVQYQQGSCPEAEKICTSIVNLPTALSKKQSQKLVKLIQQIDQ